MSRTRVQGFYAGSHQGGVMRRCFPSLKVSRCAPDALGRPKRPAASSAAEVAGPRNCRQGTRCKTGGRSAAALQLAEWHGPPATCAAATVVLTL